MTSMPAVHPVRVGVLGLGFMGQTHLRAIRNLAASGVAVRLEAVADHSPDRLGGRASAAGNLGLGGDEVLFHAAEVRRYERVDDALRAGDLDLAVVCTPTDTHAEVAAAALRAGAHVLLEKPVALSSTDVEALAAVQAQTRRRVIPGMCMRFWPGWDWLRERIRDRQFGPLVSLKFTRLGSRPPWSAFYQDDARCGGAIFDLHIHDVDFMYHCLGAPASLYSIGTRNHVNTMYRYTGEHAAVQVCAEGGWLPSSGRGFRMRYVAEFERATAEFDLAATPRVRVTADGTTRGVECPGEAGYQPQMARAVRCVAAWRDGTPSEPVATLDEAARVTRVIEAELRSLAKDGVEAIS